jgi:hypothetical protein
MNFPDQVQFWRPDNRQVNLLEPLTLQPAKSHDRQE